MPETASIPFKQRFKEGFRVYDSSNVRDRHVLTLSSKKSERSRPSAHVKFKKIPGGGLTYVRGIVFGTKSKRLVDKKNAFSDIEILTACDCKRWRDATSYPFPENEGAELGREDMYLRTGDDLILLFKGEDGKVIDICIRLTKDLRKRLDLFLQTGQANPVAS
jgi:hypothetical protein